MTELRTILERGVGGATPPPEGFERMLRRRDRKRRNQRIAAGVVGIAVFVAAIWIVTSVSSLDRSEKSVVPAGTGPVQTGPIETGPVAGPPETGGSGEPQGVADLPVSVTDYLVDLETGASTPLPESIVGTADVTGAYAVSPDGSRLAYVGRGDNGGVGIFVANIDGTGIEHVTVELRGEARPLAAPAPAWGAAPAWSPDGSKIAYVGLLGGWRGNVYLLDLATGVSTQLTDVQRGDSTSAPSFTPDGESIVYSVYSDPEVRIVPITGGTSVQLVGGDGKGASSPAPSPDGSLLSYACGVNGYDLCLANADGTDARVLVAGGGEPGGWSPDGTRIAYGTWPPYSINVVDVATGEVTTVAEGAFPTWLDGHTLIVEADSCSLPPHKGCPF